MTASSAFLHVLGADVGGTKTLLRLARVGEGEVVTVAEARVASASWSSLTPMLQQFLSGRPTPAAACIGVACPVESRRVRLTNLELWIDADEIGQICSIPRVRLINDFVAIGYGIETLGADDLVTLQAGQRRAGAPRAVLGAGTGLGLALLNWQGDHYEVQPSEGGHVDFAPVDEEQIGLLRFLMTRHGHVSCERILSGAGLVALYEYLAGTAGGNAPLPEAAAISAAALDGSDATAARALDLFLRIYGAQAGNLALTAWAQGGVYVAGGIATHVLPKLKEGGFLAAFRAKGRYRDALSAMPLHVVANPQVGLAGAVAAAARLLSRRSST